ncbi:hypothetical protein SDRG_16866 [Saprolegnia diclina VS20]|uniref:VTT domain-containing protein n=1 Tax=Saprolegnia diclina (strain VS20) TaxID=1156394 RepID=T0PIR4_SAPDV|nr:hypothetical protein SDRG_16866 [Saprolegnia diclina VS20]EQC25259.1 hypothetical protein SDRG_16866 [Saprolegnia diclina VS20]|eukprot:XP_008621311.1 hypothetical protein SDRG_16866 [Saprolegnia diclina VS20]
MGTVTASRSSAKLRATYTACKVFLVILVVTALAFGVRYVVMAHTHIINADWVESHRDISGFVCVLALWTCVLTGVPCTLLETFSGVYFGFGYAILINTAGTVLGSALAFGVARACGERLGAYLMARYPLVLALHHLFESPETNYRVLFCIQLAYVPVTLKCYSLSVLGVPFWPFLISNFVCGLPLGVFWAYVGSVSGNIKDVLAGGGTLSTDHIVVLVTSLVVSIFGLGLIWYYTRNELRRMQASAHSGTKATIDVLSASQETPQQVILMPGRSMPPPLFASSVDTPRHPSV